MTPWAIVTVVLLFSGTARPRIHQPVKVITVELGNTVTIRCDTNNDVIFWYKQIAGEQPRIVSAFNKWSEPKFYNEFNNYRFRGERLGGSFSLTISDIVLSDEAVYYCGSKAFFCEFGNGTQLIITGQHISTSQISPSDHLNDSMKCQCYENSSKQVKNAEKLYQAVLGLACALGLCGVLVFSLIAFTFRRVRVSEQDNQRRGHSSAQDTDDENVTYAALRFNWKK